MNLGSLNPLQWTWLQWKAAGRHVLTYVAGGVSVAVTLHFISGGQAQDIMQHIGEIVDGINGVVKGVMGLAAVALPLYEMWTAAHSASPNQQAKAVAAAVPELPREAKLEVINAVGEMPEVRKVVVASPSIARETLSSKVVDQ